MEVFAEFAFATAKSSLPSRLKFPVATKPGLVPAEKLLGPPNPPDPFPKRTTTTAEQFPAAKSALPSLLKSPTATDRGQSPAVKLTALLNPPVPLFSKIFMLLVETAESTTTASGRPSLLKSPTLIARGAAPALKVGAILNAGVAHESNTRAF